MTIEKFDEIGKDWGEESAVWYKGSVEELVNINFEERLLGMRSFVRNEIIWARCENCELIDEEEDQQEEV